MLVHKHDKTILPKRLVVLGGSGFVGKSVAALARSRGMETLALSSADLDLCAENAGVKLAGLLKSTDHVIVGAALDKGNNTGSEIFAKNIAMARALEFAAQKTPFSHLIYLSSDSVYAYTPSLISEKTPANPLTLYGEMHRTREMILAETRVPLAVLRLTAVYGIGDTHNAYGPNRFVRDAVRDGKITLFGEGEETRDHIYIDDAAALILETVCHGSTGILNLVPGYSLSFRALAQLIAKQNAAKIESTPRRQPITHRHFDMTARLKAFPAFVPKTMEQGITEIMNKTKKNAS